MAPEPLPVGLQVWISPNSVNSYLTLAIVVATLACLLFEVLPIGLVAVMAPLVLVLATELFGLDILTGTELWAGLGHPAVVAVGGMFVVSHALSRTGALNFVGEALANVASRGRRRILVLIITLTVFLSGVVNNTTVVLVFLPVILGMCEKMNQPPSRYLIPLSFASIMGGMTTLLGTTTNLIVAEAGRKAVLDVFGEPLFDVGMWDFLPMGLVFVLAGAIYLVFAAPRLLPDRHALNMTLSRGIPSEYVTEVALKKDSDLLGKTIKEVASRLELRVLQLIRGGVVLPPAPDVKLELDDVFLAKGTPSAIMDLTNSGTVMPNLQRGGVQARQVDMTLAEVIVPPGSRWIGHPVGDIGFRARYGVAVVALQRHGDHLREQVGNVRVEPADMLLVQGQVESLRNLRASENLILIEGVARQVKRRSHGPRALGVLFIFVGLISTGLLDIPTGAVLAAGLMIITRCLTIQDAYRAVDWDVILLLAGFLGLGKAMENVGLASDIAHGFVAAVGDAPMWLVIGALYALTSFASDVLSNTATAALMVPVVVKAAELLHMHPGALLMTVAYGASASFLTPVGYQTNLLVFAPGGYRFKDFIRIGLPLRLIYCVLAAALIPVLCS